MMTDPDPGGPKIYGSTTLIAAHIKKMRKQERIAGSRAAASKNP